MRQDTAVEPETTTAGESEQTRQLARSTLIVMVAFGLAKVISLAQTFIIAQVFGVGPEWDTYVTANRIPELIFTLIAGGALAHAFIPIFSSYLAKDERSRAWEVATHVINFIFLVTLTISVITFFAAPWLIQNFVAPGFNAAQLSQTVDLMRILLISTLIFSVSGLVMGILQSHNHFLLPAIAPMMFDVGLLGGIIFLLGPLGVNGIAIGAVIGAALHFGVQVPGLIYYRAKWSPTIRLSDPALWQVLRLMLPRVAGLGVFSLNFIIMNNIASRLGTGSISALDWGWRLMQIPQTLIGTAMGTVIFPTLAKLSELGDENGKRSAMSGALSFILITSIPSSVGLILVGRPIITLLEGGQFDSTASALVFSTLQFFALGLIFHSALEVVARSFYADKDTLTPLWAALGGALINLVLSIGLSGVSQAESALTAYGAVNQTVFNLAPRPDFGNVGGLALANSLGVVFEVVTLLYVLRRRWHGINENALSRSTAKTLVASIAMAIALIVVELTWTMIFGERGKGFTVLLIIAQVSIGGIVFLITAALLRLEELSTLLNIVRRRKTLEVPAT